MYSGQIFSLKQADVVYREVAKPPTKLMMVQKFEKYLSDANIRSGIDMAKKNFPDKNWLILAVATLSQGQDEIFDPEYVPTRKLDKQQANISMPMFQNIPAHLQAKGKGRPFRLNTQTKAEKIHEQLRAAEERIVKQQEQQLKLKESLDIMQSQDQDKIRRHQDLERIKAEVRASMNNEANEYVHQEIARAHT